MDPYLVLHYSTPHEAQLLTPHPTPEVTQGSSLLLTVWHRAAPGSGQRGDLKLGKVLIPLPVEGPEAKWYTIGDDAGVAVQVRGPPRPQQSPCPALLSTVMLRPLLTRGRGWRPSLLCCRRFVSSRSNSSPLSALLQGAGGSFAEVQIQLVMPGQIRPPVPAGPPPAPAAVPPPPPAAAPQPQKVGPEPAKAKGKPKEETKGYTNEQIKEALQQERWVGVCWLKDTLPGFQPPSSAVRNLNCLTSVPLEHSLEHT